MPISKSADARRVLEHHQNTRPEEKKSPTIMRAANVPGLNKRTPIANRTSQNRPGQPSSRFPLSTRSDRSFLIWGPPKPAAPTQTWPKRSLHVFANCPFSYLFFRLSASKTLSAHMRNNLSDRVERAIFGNLLLGPTAVLSKTVLLYASLATPAPPP